MRTRLALSAALLACLLPAARAQDTQPTEPQAESRKAPDLRHVIKGQVYTFQFQHGVQELMTVLEVDRRRGTVRYSLARVQQTEDGPPVAGEPSEEVWQSVRVDGSGGSTRRESVEVSGILFDCVVIEDEPGESTWLPMDGDLAVFPGFLRVEVAGEVAAELIRVAGGEKPRAPAPAVEQEPEPTTPDLSHVRVGQVYVYQLQNKMTLHWVVTGLTKTQVQYETVVLMDMGQGPQKVGEPTAQTWEHTAPPAGELPDPQQKEPRLESVTVSGIEFDCLVVESGGAKSWVPMTPGSDTIPTFPMIYRSTQPDGTDAMVLIEVRQP